MSIDTVRRIVGPTIKTASGDYLRISSHIATNQRLKPDIGSQSAVSSTG